MPYLPTAVLNQNLRKRAAAAQRKREVAAAATVQEQYATPLLTAAQQAEAARERVAKRRSELTDIAEDVPLPDTDPPSQSDNRCCVIC